MWANAFFSLYSACGYVEFNVRAYSKRWKIALIPFESDEHFFHNLAQRAIDKGNENHWSAIIYHPIGTVIDFN